MSRGFDFTRWAESSSVLEKFLAICGAGFVARALLTVFFHLKYGWHAVNHLELWLYTGVAQGSHTVFLEGRMIDPTAWILGLVGRVLPDGMVFYGVEATGIFLSAVTGFLLYLFVREKFGELTGFFSGLLYVFMVEPIALSISAFTHAHVQLPFILSLLVFSARLLKSDSWRGRSGYLVLALLFGFFGFKINKEMIVGVAAVLVYVVGELVPKKWVQPYLLLVCTGIVVGGVTVVPHFLGSLLADLPQGGVGSIDVASVSLVSLWIRYNVFLFLLPFGLLLCVRRGDVIGPTLLFMGLVISWEMDRGTRIMNLGAAVVVAHVLSGWRSGFSELADWLNGWGVNAYSVFSVSAVACGIVVFGFSHFFLAWNNMFQLVFGVCGLLVLVGVFAGFKGVENRVLFGVTGVLGLFLSLVYLGFSLGVLVSLAAVLAGVWLLLNGDRVLVVLLVLCFSGFCVNAVFLGDIDTGRIGYQLEYDVLDWLSAQDVSGKVLVEWDKGYMASVVSGLDPVSTPGVIRRDVHNVLWLLPGQAANYLALNNVGYVLVSSKNLNVIRRVDGGLSYRLAGGMLFNSSVMPAPLDVVYTTAYRMRSNQSLDGAFSLVAGGVDAATGESVYLYEVLQDKSDALDKASVSVLFRNRGGVRNVSGVFFYQSGGEDFSRVFNESLGVGFESLTYFLPVKKLSDCSVDVDSVGGGVLGYSGVAVFRNNGVARNLSLQVYLIDKRRSSVDGGPFIESGVERNVFLDEGESFGVDYVLTPSDLDGEYMVGFGRLPGVEYVVGESVNPVYNSFESLFVSCWPQEVG